MSIVIGIRVVVGVLFIAWSLAGRKFLGFRWVERRRCYRLVRSFCWDREGEEV